MRAARIVIAGLGIITCLSAIVPVTAEANSGSPYKRMDKMKHRSMMKHHSKMMSPAAEKTDSAQ